MAGLFDASRIYEALRQQGLLPDWSTERLKYSQLGTYVPRFNRMFAEKDPSLVSHEMTHAAQSNLLDATAKEISKKDKPTAQEAQFLEAYKKLFATHVGPYYTENRELTKQSQQQIDRLVNQAYLSQVPNSTLADKKFNEYRTSPKELQAWGVEAFVPGASNMKRYGEENVRHIDPTFAREFDILLSMYGKLPEAVRSASAQQRGATIKEEKTYRPEENEEQMRKFRFENLYADPFKPTIK